MNLWTKNNRIELLESGDDYFSKVIRLIENAEKEIIFIVYIFESDKIGTLVARKLKEAARRGVNVQLIVDGIGSPDFQTTLMPALKEAGVKIVVYQPLRLIFKIGHAVLRRLHQKIIVIDRTFALVGGINIADAQYEYFDFAVLVKGPLVLRIHKFLKLLLAKVMRRWVDYFRFRRLKLRGHHTDAGRIHAAFVVRDNLRHRNQIERFYLQAIRSAKEQIFIANSYFLPGWKFQRALYDAAARGVEVVLLLQGRTDTPFVKRATTSLYRELLSAGIKIYEYKPLTLHAKISVIDSKWATVGSCNLDLFSLFLALEANVVVEDENFAKNLKQKCDEALKNGGERIHLENLGRDTVFSRIYEYFSLLLFRFIRFLAGANAYRIGRNE